MEPSDIRSLIHNARKSPDEMASHFAARKVHVSVPVFKSPPNDSYLLVRKDGDWHYSKNAYLLLPPLPRLGNREFQFLSPVFEDFVKSNKKLAKAFKMYGLAFLVNSDGSPGIWALNLGDKGTWGPSARQGAEFMSKSWGMVLSENDHYVVETPDGDLGEPKWPDGTPDDWLVKAFSDKVIDNENHPLIKKLLGITD